MNRLERYFNAPDKRHIGDFVWVEGRSMRFAVTHDVALSIRATLGQRRTPRWIEFHDIVGSCIAMRAADVETFVESTVEQRAAERRIARIRKEEANVEQRPWEDD